MVTGAQSIQYIVLIRTPERDASGSIGVQLCILGESDTLPLGVSLAFIREGVVLAE